MNATPAAAPPTALAAAPDLLGRDFSAAGPDERWVADLTEFSTLEGKLYLAGIVDLYTGRVVGWAMSARRTAELVVDALVMAIRRRRPAAGVIHHADHGSQPTFNRSSQRFVVSLTQGAAIASLLTRLRTQDRAGQRAPATQGSF